MSTTDGPTAPLTVLYRWRVRAGAEETFVRGWELVTRAIHRSCGSHGSRLHRAQEGPWLAYARWPDRETRERCHHDETEGLELMAQSAELVEVLHLEQVSDLLDDTSTASPTG
jgi:hypothetical protein